MTEKDVQLLLFKQYVKDRRKRVYRLATANTYLYKWESDFLGLTSYSFFHEFEIKLSHQDFQADMRKPKHNMLRSYYNSPGTPSSQIPKRFYYVIHGFWINAKELPPYAGLIILTDDGHFKKVRIAPDLPAAKITQGQTAKMATSLCFHFWNALEKQHSGDA